jgi:hypothetical protein
MEQHPFMREVFPYQNYASGQMRQTVLLAQHLVEGITKKDPTMLLSATKRLFTMAATYGAAGLMINYLREALFMKTPHPGEDEKALYEKFLSSLFEVQFLGPVGRMLTGVSQNESSYEKVALNFFPKFQALGSGLATVYNFGALAMGEPDKTMMVTGKLSPQI